MEEAGLSVERIVGIESPIALVPELEEWVQEKGRLFELALKYARTVEEEAVLLGASFHLLGVGKRS